MASDDIPAPDFSPHSGRDSGRGHNSRGEGMRGSRSGHLSSPQNSSRGSDPSGDNTVPHWFLEYESRSRNTGRTVPIPSNLCFSGGKNDNFANFESRLDKFLNVHKIMDHDMILFYLSNMFRDKASLFFEDLVHRNPRFGFNSLMDALRKRFGDNRLDQAAILEFNAAEQYDGEDVRDYAQRLWSLEEVGLTLVLVMTNWKGSSQYGSEWESTTRVLECMFCNKAAPPWTMLCTYIPCTKMLEVHGGVVASKL